MKIQPVEYFFYCKGYLEKTGGEGVSARLLYIFLPGFALIHGGRARTNSRKNHSRYWLFPKPITSHRHHHKIHLQSSRLIKVILAASSLAAIAELCCFCLFLPPDKLPPHLILGDFPRVRFEVLRGFVKTSDGKLPDKLQFYPLSSATKIEKMVS